MIVQEATVEFNRRRIHAVPAMIADFRDLRRKAVVISPSSTFVDNHHLAQVGCHDSIHGLHVRL